jgi:hypothetical protein
MWMVFICKRIGAILQISFFYFADMLLSSCDKKEKYMPNVKQQHIFLPHTAACPD